MSSLTLAPATPASDDMHPSWCTEHGDPRAACSDSGAELIPQFAPAWTPWPGTEQPDAITVYVFRDEAERPCDVVVLQHQHCSLPDMTPAEARQLAGALLNAADRAESCPR